MSLYPMHLARWLQYFPCQQLLLVKSDGSFGERGVHIGKFTFSSSNGKLNLVFCTILINWFILPFFFTFLDSSCLHYFFLFFSFSFPLATILVLRPIAQFIGVSEDSAVRAAAAEAVRPEQFTYNQEANALSQLANGGKTVSVAEKNERAIPNWAHSQERSVE